MNNGGNNNNHNNNNENGGAAGVDNGRLYDFEEQERLSFEDSDRFEEDSLCSWISEPESVVNNWRGWRKQSSFIGRTVGSNSGQQPRHLDKDGGVLSLTELAAREVASSIPFEAVERVFPPVPEPLQLRIAYYSFPDLEEDIRLYSCLAHGSAEEFTRGENLFKNKAVKDPLQIGFHLSATVNSAPIANGKPSHSTSVNFDRKKIVSVQCSCGSAAEWCCHLVALCLHRIHLADTVKLRAPVSESLTRLQRDDLQKFAQYLISELYQQILPTAQRLLDDLLSGPRTLEINAQPGAPDPTAGGSVGEISTWCLDSKNLRDNIKKILIKFCMPSPIVFSDVNYLSTTAPQSAAEWSSFLRPLRGREPEGMWNLLSIVREMYKRNDRNSLPLLEIVTLQCLETAQIMIWWFNTKVAFQQTGQGKHNVNSNSQASQNACASMCDEIVTLWKLAALNPCISPPERESLKARLINYHTTVVEKVQSNQTNTNSQKTSNKNGKLSDVEIFSGFKPAIEACYLDWQDYPIPGVTYGHNPKYVCPFTALDHQNGIGFGGGAADILKSGVSGVVGGACPVNSSPAVLRCEFPAGVSGGMHHARPRSSGHRSRTHSENKSVGVVNGLRDQDEAGPSGGGAVRCSISSEGDEGVEEAPSQSEGELADGEVEKVTDRLRAVKVQDGTDKGFKDKADESSPERELESDWSSGHVDQEAEVAVNANTSKHHHQQLDPHQQQHPDYTVYFYAPKASTSGAAEAGGEDGVKEGEDVFKNLRKIDDPWEILMMRAEGLHAHGYQSHASEMAVRLALDMLKNPPDLITDAPPISFKGKKRRVCAASHQITQTASTTLTHCAFICTVLSEMAINPDHLNLAFRIGMFGLEMARPPASTKPMEVKLAHQESELVALLKRLPLGPSELSILRERGVQLREGSLKSRGEALLPLMLASFIFDSLVLPSKIIASYNRNIGDDQLGFDAAVAAIGLKANVSEADHPLLCEGTRRQRGDLTLTLLVSYKDDPDRLAKIMDKLLDKDIHQMCKTPLLSNYYTCQGSRSSSSSNNVVGGAAAADFSQHPPPLPHQYQGNHYGAGADMGANLGARPRDRVRRTSRENQMEPSTSQGDNDNKAWEARFRCANLRVNKPKTPGHHMASIDSSAPETASSDNSPTFVRRIRPPPSDTSSSGNSSDSSGSRGRHGGVGPRPDSPSQGMMHPPPLHPPRPGENNIVHYQSNHSMGPGPSINMMEMTNLTRTTLPNIKVTRFKGKKDYLSIPNHPSEASAHFMFELAKTVLTKAGGTSTSSLFTQPTSNQNPRGPQRALHMCAFQIGLYALGLHNRVSSNWISRTYSSHVSWITSQAMDIGATAIRFLINTWTDHLTPSEVASIADGASRGRDPAMVGAAAELALSCLNQAHALNPNDIARAIMQCKEHSDMMLEKACLAVEEAARGGGVYPEVMFSVAKHWYELWKKRAPGGGEDNTNRREVVNHRVPPVTQHGNMSHPPPPTPVSLAQQQQNSMAQISSIPLTSNPIFYSLIGYPNSLQSQIPLPMQMYPLHHPLLPTLPGSPAQPGYSQFHGLPNLPGLQVYPNMDHTAGPRFGLQAGAAGSPLFHIAAIPNLQGMSMPLLPNPPTTQHLAGPGAGMPGLLPHPAPASSPIQPHGAGPAPPSPAAHHHSNEYLLSSFRVGMLALETLGRRVSEDRPQNNFIRNPSYADDVKWLLNIAKKIGIPYLQNFLLCVLATVVSPYLLQDLTWECGCYFANAPPNTTPNSQSHYVNAVIQQIRSQPYITPLVQKCYQMYFQSIQQKIHHLTTAEYDDFTSIILHARKAYMWTSNGQNEFQNLLNSLRRNKIKKELMNKITAAVQNASLASNQQ